MKNLQKWDIDFLTAGYIFKLEQGFEDYKQENVMSCTFIAEFIVLWTASRIF